MNFGIRGKMLASFGTLVLLMTLVGLIGWRFTNELSQSAIEMDRDNVQGTIYLSQAESALWQLRYGIAQYVSLGQEQGAYIRTEEGKWFNQVEEAIEAYSRGNRTEEELKALKVWHEWWPKYFGSRAPWFDLVASGDAEKAAKFRAENTTRFGVESVSALNKLVELQQEVAAQRLEELTRNAAASRRTLLGLVAVAIVLGLLLSLVMSSNLSKPLLRSVDQAEAIAQGNLDQRIDVTRRDEIGQLETAMRDMTERLRRVISDVRGGADALRAPNKTTVGRS